MINLKKSNGSISVMVLVTILFIVTILSATYVINATIKQSQLKSQIQLKETYEKEISKVAEVYSEQYAKLVDNVPPTASITVSSTVVLKGGNITATIKQEDNRDKLDLTKCKYVYNTTRAKLGTDESKYTGGVLSSENTKINLSVDSEGAYYLHVLTVDTDGNATETVSSCVNVISSDSITYASANTTDNPYYTFTAPEDGTYKLQVWGAQGGSYNTSYAVGGLGGYSTGNITLSKGEMLYIYVGGQGSYSTTTTYTTPSGGGYNGGGAAGYCGGTGGGATDIRLVSGACSDSTSLLSRIIVAGGGGGAYAYSSTYKANGGYAGGDSGSAGSYYSSSYSAWVGGGGTQTSGGTAGTGSSTNYYGKAGSFGQGGATGYKYNSTSYYSNGAGGGGWYGGGGAGNYSSRSRARAAGGGRRFWICMDFKYCFQCTK